MNGFNGATVEIDAGRSSVALLNKLFRKGEELVMDDELLEAKVR